MRGVERLNVIVYEGDGAMPLADGSRAELFAALLDRGYGVTRVRDQVPPARTTPRIVVGVKNGIATDAPSHFPEIQDITALDAAGVVSLVEEANRAAQAPAPGGWKPWFPVIDYSRCTNCMQCLSFCLFDVYGVTADRQIQVQNPTNCKTECPACSRVCPEVAIMFPKYRHAPINGDVVSGDDVRREAMKVDISALLGGDVYSVLRDRSAKAKSRFSKERDEDRALRERQTCLVKLQQQLDVPPQVLAALPSVDEIRARAEAAAARAREARSEQAPE